MPRRNYELQRLHFNDTGSRTQNSGVNATLFGADSVLGMTTGTVLTSCGSTVVYPYKGTSTIWDDNFKEIKVTADLGYKAYVKLQDFTAQGDIDHVIRDQNTVINCIGS
jgi:NADH dehydrogenase (ubiquinone) 1 alpha subcomplex subunit 9